jgi:hypothetical protein
MDRDQLALLLDTGGFLCYHPNRLSRAADVETPDAPLFDSPLLTNAVFFKEAVASDPTDGWEDYVIRTRAMIAFDEANARDGGASFPIDPETFESALEGWFGRKVAIVLSDHDRNVLGVLDRVPTFDPFLMLAQRAEMERERAIDPVFFSADPTTAEAVRAVAGERARRLVALAMGDTKGERLELTVDALIDAIWTCETNKRTGRLFASLGIPKSDVERVLFAWKGISYYDHLFREFGRDYAAFLVWLKGPESLPKDEKAIPQTEVRRLRSLRHRARRTMRDFYTHATDVLKQNETAYAALVERGDPVPFQKFLLAAPGLFQSLGLAIGGFGHAANAWKTMTNDGLRPTRKAAALDPFYRFVADLGVMHAG